MFVNLFTSLVRPFFQGISLRIIMFHHLSSVAIASAREDKVMLSSNFSSCHQAGPHANGNAPSVPPKCSMYGIFTCICLEFMVYVGKYAIYGASRICAYESITYMFIFMFHQALLREQ